MKSILKLLLSFIIFFGAVPAVQRAPEAPVGARHPRATHANARWEERKCVARK